MSCLKTRDLLHGYVDGELDLVKSLEIEEHLKECHDCAGGYQAIRTMRSAVGETAVRFEPPPNFEGRLRSALRRESEPNARALIIRWRWIVAAVSLIVALTVTWAVAALP